MAQDVEVKLNLDLGDADKKLENFGKGISSVSDRTIKTNKDTKDYTDTLKSQFQQNQSVTKAQQDLSSATGGMSDVMIKSASSIKLVNGGFTGMKTAIIETGIGALVVLVGYLVGALAKLISKEEESKKALEDTSRALDEQGKAFDDLTEKNEFYNEISLKTAKADGASKEQLRATNNKYLQGERNRTAEQLRLLEVEHQAILQNDNLNDEARTKALEKWNTDKEKMQSLSTKFLRQQQTANIDAYVEDKEALKDAQQKKQDAIDKANETAKQKREQSKQQAIADAKAQHDALKSLEKKYLEDIENLKDDTEQQKLDRQKERALKELEALKLTAKEKAKALALINEDFKIKQEDLEKSQADKLLALTSKLEDDKKNLLAKTDSEKLLLSQEKAKLQLEKDLITINADETAKRLARKNLQDNFDLQDAELKAKKLQAEKDEKVNMIALQLEDETVSYEEKKALIKEREDLLLSNTALTESQRLKIHKDSLDAEKKLDNAKAKGKEDMIKAINQSLQLASKIAGEETEAGKALSIASALINTYQGITAGVALGFPLAIPAVAMAAYTGFEAVKNILAVKVPNGGGGGSGGGGSMTPPAMSAPNINVVGASQTNQIAETVSQQNQPPIKAYVVGNEVSTQQALDRNIIKSATIG
jgi:hypothetical protein